MENPRIFQNFGGRCFAFGLKSFGRHSNSPTGWPVPAWRIWVIFTLLTLLAQVEVHATVTPPPFVFPQLTISQPAAGSIPFRTNSATIALAGTVSDPFATVTVQGNPATKPDPTNWVMNGVSLTQEGDNLITVSATDPDGARTVQTLVVNRDTSALQPMGLQVLPNSSSTNEILWLAAGESDLDYTRIYRRSNRASSTNETLIGTVPAPATRFLDTNIAGTAFCYKIQTVDTLGNQSAFSDEVCPGTSGAGGSGAFYPAGGSIGPGNIRSSPIASTALSVPRPIRETNGDVRVRYIDDWSSGLLGSGTTSEWGGPHCKCWNPGYIESLPVFVEKSGGFGAKLQVTITPPAGWIISSNNFIGYGSFVLNSPAAGGFYSLGSRGVFTCGQYPKYGSSGKPASAAWDASQSASFMGDVWHDTNSSYTMSSNQLTFSVSSSGIFIGTDPQGNPIYSGPGNIIDVAFYLDLQPLDPFQIAGDRAPKAQITANGKQVEEGLFLELDPDPAALSCLSRPIDDQGGAVDLFSGDYSFQVPLFAGQGSGLNVDGILSYSSINSSWDLAARQQRSATNYSQMPLGPGWGYPYGMKIFREDKIVWNQGVPSPTNDALLLACPDGRVTQWFYDTTANQYGIQGGSIFNSSIIHGPAPSWAEFVAAVIVATPSGYVLREAQPTNSSYQEIDFDTRGRMTQILPQGGSRPIRITYAGAKQIVTDSSGRITEFSFDASGKIIQIADPAGGDWELGYSSGGALTNILESATSYGWQFAYDATNYFLTERKFPNGFVLQSSYDTDPISNGRFFWGALKSTCWKENAATSTRAITYDRIDAFGLDYAGLLTFTTNSVRVAITAPSGRNTSFFDLDPSSVSSILYGSGAVTVTRSDEVEGSPKTLRYLGGDESDVAIAPHLDQETRINASGDQRYYVRNGPYPVDLIREDGTAYLWQSTGQTTLASPASVTGWRGYSTHYDYYDPQSSHERLKAVFPAGQDPSSPTAHSIQYGYDTAFRVQSVTDMDSNTTQIVYYNTPGKLGLPYRIIPLANLATPTTTGQSNLYAWTFDYDGLGRTTSVTDPNQNVTLCFYDRAGRLREILGPTNAAGKLAPPETDFSYQGDLLIQETSQNSGRPNLTTSHVYDNQGRLLQEIRQGNDPAGAPNTTAYAYDADNNLTNILYPNGGSAVRDYDNRGRLTNSIEPMGETTQYTYDDANDQVVDTCRMDGGEKRTWTVAGRDQLRRVTHLQLPTVTQGGITGRPNFYYGYDPDGNMTNQTYSFGGSTNGVASYFGYFDEAWGTATDMGGGQAAVERLDSDYQGRTISYYGIYTVANGSVGPAYIQSETNRTGPTIVALTYSPFSTISKILDQSGNQRAGFGLDYCGLLKQIFVPNPAVPQVGGGIQANTSALRLTRDNFSGVKTVSDVFNATSTITRDQLGRVQSATDPAGTQVVNSWSPAGDCATTTTTAGGAALDATRAAHDDQDNLTQVIAPGNNGSGTSFQYDRSGRLTSQTDAAGKTTGYQYNAFGELTNQIYPSGAHITYVHDQMGRATLSTEYGPNGNVTRTETTQYDWRGNVSSAEDANYRLEYDWDNLHRMLARRTIFKRLNVTNELDYRYGAYGDLVSEQDSEGYVTKYDWDDAGNLRATTLTPPTADPQQVQRVNIYPDAVGRVTGWGFVSGSNAVVSAALSRDEKGRLTKLSYSGSGVSAAALPSIGYGFDARDLVTNITDYSKGLSAVLGYDPRGNLSSETWSQLSDGSQVYQDQIGYDPAGNRTWRQLNGNLSTYNYNAIYQLAGETGQSVLRVATNLISVRADSTNSSGRYDPNLADGLFSPDSDVSGTGWRSDTNAADHWIELDLTNTPPISICSVEVSVPTARGGLDNLQVEVASSAGGSFQPVALYQIIQGFRVSTNAVGTHDHTVRVTFLSPQLAAAIRIFIPLGGTAVNPVTHVQLPDVVMNQVALYQIVNQVITRSYDPDGRLISDGAFTCAYDVQGHLTGIVGPGVNKTWTITPDGLRGSETDNLTGETRYLANDGANAYLEFSATGGKVSPRLRHFNGPGLDDHIGFFEYTNGQAQFRWSLIQGQGDVRQVIDTSGNVLDDRIYTVWGQDLISPKVSSANPYGFAGARQDSGTGLCYNRARMYDPRAGRFQATDPYGMIDGPNLYLYAGNNPVSSCDPSGLLEFDFSPENLNESKEVLIGEGLGVVNVVGGLVNTLWSAATLPSRLILNPVGTIQAQIDSAAETILGAYEGTKNFANDPIGSGRRFNAHYSQMSTREYASVISENAIQIAGGEILGAGLEGREASSLLREEGVAARESIVAEEAVAEETTVCRKGIPGGCFAAGTPIATAEGSERIESLHVGDRVLNSDEDSSPSAVDPRGWRKIEVELPNPDCPADIVHIELLRPLAWIAQAGAQTGSTFWLDLDEMGLRGPAVVRCVTNCPAIAPGEGRVILSTVTDLSSFMFELKFRGHDEPLELTGRHRLYSASQNNWVAAATLRPGEWLRTCHGTVQVESVTPETGTHRVHNLEVESQHCYFAGAEGVLSHNVEPCFEEPVLGPKGTTVKFQEVEWKQRKVKGRTVLQRMDQFDPAQLETRIVDGEPITKANLEWMREGKPPRGYDGRSIELHHENQMNNGRIVEMQHFPHKKLSEFLHKSKLASEIERAEFNTWTRSYWKERALDF